MAAEPCRHASSTRCGGAAGEGLPSGFRRGVVVVMVVRAYPETQLGADHLGNVILCVICLQDSIITHLQQRWTGSSGQAGQQRWTADPCTARLQAGRGGAAHASGGSRGIRRQRVLALTVPQRPFICTSRRPSSRLSVPDRRTGRRPAFGGGGSAADSTGRVTACVQPAGRCLSLQQSAGRQAGSSLQLRTGCGTGCKLPVRTHLTQTQCPAWSQGRSCWLPR